MRPFNKCIYLLLLIISPVTHAWQSNISPYLWAMNMNGDVDVGNVHAHVNEEFDDLIKHFRGGGMVWLDINNDKFSLFANALYAVLSNTTSTSGYDIYSKEKFWLYTIGA